MLWHVSENYLITKQHGGKNSLRCTDNLAMIAFFCLHSTGAAIFDRGDFLLHKLCKENMDSDCTKKAKTIQSSLNIKCLTMVCIVCDSPNRV